MNGIIVSFCPKCGMGQVVTSEHHVCSSCGYDFFDETEADDDQVQD